MRQETQNVCIFFGALCLATLWIHGCTDEQNLQPPEPPARPDRIALVATDAWVVVSAEQDPFEDRPENVTCDADTAIQAEELGNEPVWSVDTGDCGYVTATQSLRTDLRVGETLVVRIWHFDLQANEPAQAHVALQIQDRVVWERSIAIPSTSRLLYETWTVDAYVPEGAPIYAHLHNHGANSWSWIEISTGGDVEGFE